MTPENTNHVQGSSPPGTNGSIQTPRDHRAQHQHQHQHQLYRRPSVVAQGGGHPHLHPQGNVPSPAYSNTSVSLVTVLPPPQEGKGLLSWIYNESAPGKTLGKGYVRLNPLPLGRDGLGGDEDDEDDDDDDDDDGDERMDGDTERGDEHEEDAVDGLEGLVRAAERRAKRQAERRERAMASSRSGSEHVPPTSRTRTRTFGLELNVLLKSVPAAASSTGASNAGINPVEDELDVKPIILTGMKTSMDLLGARAASQGQIVSQSNLRPQAASQGPNKNRPSLGNERAASSPGLLAAMAGTQLSTGTRSRRISALPTSKSMVASGTRAEPGSWALNGATMGKTTTTMTIPTTTIDLTGPKPKVVQSGSAAGDDHTPPRPPVVPGTSSGGTLIADILRTPRQGSKKTGAHNVDSMQTDRPPQSSPATHMALARQVLRNPTSHTLDLAQKLVGKDKFAQILIEMGVQVGSPAEPVAGSSRQGQTGERGEATSTAAGTAITRARAKGTPAVPATVKGKGKASTVATGSSISTELPGKSVPPVPAVKPVCKNCGTTETPRWRVKTLADGKERRVCDACGIYFNKTKQMRPKELWSPNAKRIPLEDIPKQEAAMAASRAAAAKQMAALGKASTTTTATATATSINNPVLPPKRSANTQPAPLARPPGVAEQTQRINEVSFAELPASPPRQARTLSESVFTTPRRSTRLSQGGSSKNPRAEQDEAGASPKLRRTPRRMAATAAASKVKATFENHAGAGARQHKLGHQAKDESHDEPKPAASMVPFQSLDTSHSPSRDRSLTPPPVSEAASRHNDPSAWQIQTHDMLDVHHGSNDLFERFTAIGNGVLDAGTSDTDQLDYDLSTWIDMPPLDAEVEAAAPALPEPVADNQDIKFTLDEMNLLLHLTQTQDMIDFSEQTDAAVGTMPMPDWDPSSPWSLPTPSGGSISVPKTWLDNSLSAEIAGDSGQTY